MLCLIRKYFCIKLSFCTSPAGRNNIKHYMHNNYKLNLLHSRLARCDYIWQSSERFPQIFHALKVKFQTQNFQPHARRSQAILLYTTLKVLVAWGQGSLLGYTVAWLSNLPAVFRRTRSAECGTFLTFRHHASYI